MKSRYLIILLVLTCFCQASFGQSRKIDSLRNVLKTLKDDTNKINALNSLSIEFRGIGKYDTSVACANSAQTLAKNISSSPEEATAKAGKNGLIKAYNIIANVYTLQGDYAKALEYDIKSLKLNEELRNKSGIAKNKCNIGNVYKAQGDYPKALEYYFKSLEEFEELKNKSGIATNTCDIGIVYEAQLDYPKALEYYFKALKIFEELGDKRGITANTSNIGFDYQEQGNYPKALEYYFKALKMCEEINDKSGIARSTGNIGAVFQVQGDYPKALEYYFKALKIYEALGEKGGTIRNTINISYVLIKQKNYKRAKVYLDSALILSKNIGEKEYIKSAYSGLKEYDSATGNFNQAFTDYKNYITYRDSLINEAATKKSVQTEMNFEFEQKQAAEKAEQDKKDLQVEADKRKQIIVIWSTLVGLLLVLVFAGFVFRSLRITRRQKQVIETKSKETEEQKKVVEERNKVIEEKNKDILDSITYAKRLQDAILPPLSLVKQYLPESFLLYKPKDIVAGDFYWMERVGDTILIAAADSTGHGVPGAMVSVVCSNALNRTVKEFKITEPGKILDKVRELVLETFEKSEDNVQDGMDISLASLTPYKEGITLSWAGAFNSLWYLENGVMQEIPADKQPIGKTDNPKPFTTHTLEIPLMGGQKGAGTMLYLFTDGYADQFGGPKGKKFKYKQLQELLLANAGKSMDEQKKVLESSLNEWKGELEQVDDILVIGIKV